MNIQRREIVNQRMSDKDAAFLDQMEHLHVDTLQCRQMFRRLARIEIVLHYPAERTRFRETTRLLSKDRRNLGSVLVEVDTTSKAKQTRSW